MEKLCDLARVHCCGQIFDAPDVTSISKICLTTLTRHKNSTWLWYLGCGCIAANVAMSSELATLTSMFVKTYPSLLRMNKTCINNMAGAEQTLASQTSHHLRAKCSKTHAPLPLKSRAQSTGTSRDSFHPAVDQMPYSSGTSGSFISRVMYFQIWSWNGYALQ